ncbi:hypothetical protein LPJ70_000916, partial [Coemansia sp. RSA 2708]
MVSYTDLSPLKQPDAPVVVHLNDPVQAPARKPEKVPRRDTRQPAAEHQSPEEWLRSWDQLHTKVLYFKGVTEDALPELQQLFKSCRGTRLNVDPHDSLDIAGNVQFRNVFD